MAIDEGTHQFTHCAFCFTLAGQSPACSNSRLSLAPCVQHSCAWHQPHNSLQEHGEHRQACAPGHQGYAKPGNNRFTFSLLAECIIHSFRMTNHCICQGCSGMTKFSAQVRAESVIYLLYSSTCTTFPLHKPSAQNPIAVLYHIGSL